MMKYFPIPILAFLFFTSCGSNSSSRPVTGSEFISKSIEYHDPNDQWKELKATFVFEDSIPPPRISRSYSVSFDNVESSMSYAIDGSKYKVYQDSLIVEEGEIKEEQALRMRDYYTFLWGLPMKLNDPGTFIDPTVYSEALDGVDYHVVRVPYEKDTWYFYLEPVTFRLAAYKFYQDEANQKGEIIYLSEEKGFKGMRIPANRTWYKTGKPEFLGMDRLIEIK